MEENKSKIKAELKGFAKKLALPAIIFVIVLMILVGGVYIIQKDDFDKVAETTSNYTASVDQNGNIVYTEVNRENVANRKRRRE